MPQPDDQRPPQHRDARAVRSPSRWRHGLAVAIMLAALAVAAAALQWGGSWRTPFAGPQATPGDEDLASRLDRALARGSALAPGIALRPLAAGASAPELAALAEVTCTALAERLARLPALRIVPCRSTAGAIASGLDDRRLARLLAVRYVLRGELSAVDGGRVRVRMELLAPDDERAAWHLDSDWAVADLQRLPARVSEAVGGVLGVRDAGPVPATIAGEAYLRYARAVELASRPSIEGRRSAVRLLDEVLAVAPDHVPSLLLRHSLRGFLLGNEDAGARQTLEQLNAARQAHVAQDLEVARRVLALEPHNVRAQVVLLGHEIELRRWVDAFARLDGLLDGAAGQAGMLRLAARLHLHAGYLQRARELALLAARHNALDAEAVEILAVTAGFEGRDAEMRELATVARQLGHEGLGRIEVVDAWRRRDWAALERAQAAWISWGGTWPADWVPAWVRGVADPAQRDAAAAMLDGHDEATRQHFVGYFVEHALLGDTARSLRAVRHHASLPPATWMQELWWPELAGVRQSPGFVEAMADLGFVALWDARGAPDRCARTSAGWACR